MQLKGILPLSAASLIMGLFVSFSTFYMKEKPQLNLVWAGFCLLGAVYFIFRDGPGTHQ
jgi:uncharacterized protein (DUF486 family)